MFQIWICRPRAVSITHASREGLPHRRSYAGGSIFGPEISSDTKLADVKCQSVCFDICQCQGRFGQHTIKTHQISARPKMSKPTRLMSKPRFDIKRVFFTCMMGARLQKDSCRSGDIRQLQSCRARGLKRDVIRMVLACSHSTAGTATPKTSSTLRKMKFQFAQSEEVMCTRPIA